MSNADGMDFLNTDNDNFVCGDDGSWGNVESDGSGSFSSPDGSWGYRDSDGTGSYYGADGSWGYRDSDGNTSFYGKDGSYSDSNSINDYSSTDNNSSTNNAENIANAGEGLAALVVSLANLFFLLRDHMRDCKTEAALRHPNQKRHSLFLWIVLSILGIGLPFLIFYSVSKKHCWY